MNWYSTNLLYFEATLDSALIITIVELELSWIHALSILKVFFKIKKLALHSYFILFLFNNKVSTDYK